jgi:N-acetylneuraminate synthase
MKIFKIADIEIGANQPYFIAEIGSNFDGSLSRAIDLIYMAKESGAQAAKFQHYTATTLVSDLGFQTLGGHIGHQRKWKNSVYDVYENASLDSSWTAELYEVCNKVGIHFMTSAYSLELVEFVDPYVSAHKIGSGDITWLEIIEAVSKKDKPVLLATGASTLEDVVRAMNVIQANSNRIILMQCNTNYSGNEINYRHQNLRVLELYRLIYSDVILGLSDHTQSDTAVLGAYALGARVFEKHFTDDTSRPGPDHQFAITPTRFKDMVDKVSELEMLMGSHTKSVELNELETSVVQRRSIHAARDIHPGEVLKKSDFVALRPSPEGSVPPYLLDSLVGKKIKKALSKGHTIKFVDLE